jgi:Ferric iron reductase FhuF-like transporter
VTAPADLRAALERLAEPAPHLRWRLVPPGEPLAGDELACADLAGDPEALAAAVAASAAGRGSDDPQVLASLWWQAYAYRVAGTALACWLVTGVAPDVRVEATAVGVARSRPSSVVYLVTKGTRGDDSRSSSLEAMTFGGRTSLPRESSGGSHCLASQMSATHDGEVAAFVDGLFTGHLDRVAGSLRARHALGRSLVWGNVAAACASAAGSVQAVAGAGWRGRLGAFLQAAPHGLSDLGRWSHPPTPVGPAPPAAAGAGAGPSYRRTTCCLWWKTATGAGALCADCSLARSPIENAPA